MDYFYGYFVGTVQVIVGHPLETLKVRYQTKKFSSLNIKSLYQGVSYPLLTSGVNRGVMIGTYSLFVESFENVIDKKYIPWVSGSLSGLICSFIICPVEQLKIQKQIIISSKSLYSSWKPTALRETISISLYFGIYSTFRQKNINPVLSGSCTGILTWFLIYPLDIYKVQSQAGQQINIFSISAWKFLPLTLLRSGIVSGIGFGLYHWFGIKLL